MKKIIIVMFALLSIESLSSQEIKISKPSKVFYKSMDQVIETYGEDGKIAFRFQDDRFKQLTVVKYVLFEDKKAMLHFFNKLQEVQMMPKTDKKSDIAVDMSEHVFNKENVRIVRYGFKQFVTYIYIGQAYTIIPKSYLKRLIKKINK